VRAPQETWRPIQGLVRSGPLRRGLLAVFAAVAVASAAPSATALAPDEGYRDFSFGTAAPAPTAKDPQSKLWFNDGIWWASLYHMASGSYHIYRLNWATQTWTDTATSIDERDSARSDVLWDGTHLYVVTAGTNESTSSHGARVLRFSYSSASKAYTLDTGFPITISSGGTQAATIAKDTTGKLWVTFTQNLKVWVTHTTVDDRTWVTPFVLPATGSTSAGSNGLEEAAMVAYDSKIGIMYSNQDTWAHYFAIHADGDPANVWQSTVAHQATEEADNHINLKALSGDPAGRVFAVAKTSLNAPSDPLYYLMVLKPDGTWTKHVFGRVSDDHTRAELAIDTDDRELYVFATSPCCNGGTIYYKKTSLDSISFASGKGTPLMQSATDTHLNNVTSTKQTLSAATGFLAVASDDSSNNYFHSAFDLGSADTTPPETTIDSGPSGVEGSDTATFTFSANEAGSTFDCRLDGAPYAACASPKTYNGLSEGSHTFDVRATDGAGNPDPSPASRTWTVDTTTQTVTFSAEADARVEQLAPDANFGVDPKLVADSSPNTESYLRFNVLGIDGTVLSAKLRLYVTNGTTNGPALYTAPNTWSEPGITWNNRPPRNPTVIEDEGSIPKNTWVEFNVLSVVNGDGTYTFNVRPMSTDGLDANSRESTSPNKPQLVIQAMPDSTPPETTIDSGPTGSVSNASATFAFSANEAGSTFACSLDGSSFAACTSPQSYGGLGDGSHTFQVRATDDVGNTDPTAASRTWTVDTTAPAAPAIEGPADGSTTNSSTVTISGMAEPDSVVEVFEGPASRGTTLADGSGAWAKPLLGVAEGMHTYTAKASDAAGNESPSSNVRTVTVDTTAPETSIDSGPSGTASSTSASFTFSASEGSSAFTCSLDGAAFSTCTSPREYTALSEGVHTFRVRATDPVGNTDSTPAGRTWTIDSSAPTVTSVTPADGATGFSATASVEASFSEAVDPATLSTTTFRLVNQATGLPVAAFVSYDSGSQTAILDPSDPLELATTYIATVVGGAGGVADPAGNALAADKVWSFTTNALPDLTPPETTIDSGPSGTISSSSAAFAFSASESGSTFECKLDSGTFSTCTSPKSYSSLTNGSHTFEVRATDAAGNTDLTPAGRTWTVDTVAPAAPVIESPPDGSLNTTGTVTVSGTAEPTSTVELFEGATSKGTTAADAAGNWSKTLTLVAEGSHTYTAKAGDAAGNTSAASNARTVTVDTTAPETTIDSGPSGTIASTSATFTFSASEGGSTFECKLDGGAFAACTSPQSYNGLAEGAHTFQVRATDPAGHADATPASRTWTVSLVIFTDGFEDGSFSAWSLVNTGGDGSATVQSSVVKTGTFAALLSETANTGSFAYVRKPFTSTQTDLRVTGNFRVLTEGASGGNVPFFRLFDSSGTRLVSLYRQNLSGDKVQVNYNGTTFITTGRLPLNTWGQLELHVITAGTGASTVEVRLDGTLVHQSNTASLGTSGILTMQIGNETAKQTFTLAADDITARIG
jgi:hypothetical protein